MFRELIAEARALCKRRSRKVKDLDERPEVSVGSGLSFPRRGLDQIRTYSGTSRSTTAHSTHSQTPS